jgi:signal peptidase I
LNNQQDNIDNKKSLEKSVDMPDTELLQRAVSRIKTRRSYLKVLWSTISSLMIVAAAAVLISMLFLPVLRVTGTSMTPTLQNDELVVCKKRGSFKKGDVIAFYYNNKILLKRVIGTAGDVIDIKSDGTVILNGEEIDEPYVDEKALGECDISLPYQVPEGRIFVMGDHRATSIDSRTEKIGCVTEEAVVGKVVFRITPLKKLGFIE